MWRQASRPPDLMNLGPRYAAYFRHVAHRPMGGIRWRWFLQGQADDLGHFIVIEWRNARRPELIAQQPVHASFDIALLPTPHRRFGQSYLSRLCRCARRSAARPSLAKHASACCCDRQQSLQGAYDRPTTKKDRGSHACKHHSGHLRK